ncbi:hypothetical protein, partial [Algoriphagus sp.]|uniref:hypothetical protein n=1 Tax=Algoriphagus sp. TaxID=1872435 RepID=UPI003F72E31B
MEENTTYFITVIPFNEAGEAAGCDEYSFTTETHLSPPDCATITFPSDNAENVGLNPTITWQAASGAEGYYLSVGTSSGGAQILDREEVIGTSYTLSETLEENTTYFITVIPFNEAGEAAGCDEYSFTTETHLSPPDCATITFPSDNAENVGLNPTITWQAASGAEGYYLSVGTSSGGVQILDREEVIGTSYTLSETLEENTTYFITVIPFNEAGEAAGCDEYSFTTETLLSPPDCATITFPSDNAENVGLNPRITWQAASGAEGYYLSVGTSSGGAQILDREEVTGTSYVLTETLEESTTYFITVIPFNEAGEATGCDEFSFSTETLLSPPDCTAITSPSNGSTDISLNPTITWQAASGAEGYYLSLGTSSGGTQILDREEVIGTSHTLTETLEESTTYFITVIPFNEVGEAEGCAEISFTTASMEEPTLPSCTTITSPSNEATDVDLTPTIIWQPASGADGYYLSLGTSSGGTQILDREEVTGTSYGLTET